MLERTCTIYLDFPLPIVFPIIVDDVHLQEIIYVGTHIYENGKTLGIVFNEVDLRGSVTTNNVPRVNVHRLIRPSYLLTSHNSIITKNIIF